MNKSRAVLLAAIGMVPCFAAARVETIQVPVNSGTGFFINDEYVVTDEHVVGVGCSQIILQKNGVDWTTAGIVAADKERDLALLHAAKHASRSATLRHNFAGLNNGDKVEALGYPTEALGTGKYAYVTAQVVNAHDSLGNARMLQYTHSTALGFSGGPLMDESGNVVGVVKGGIRKYESQVTDGKEGASQLVSQVNEATNAPTLQAFLAANGLAYLAVDSGARLDDAALQERAAGFVVNVQCVEQPLPGQTAR